MQIKEFDDDKKENWNKFILQSPFANPLQSWQWGEVKKDATWEVLRLGVYQKTKLVAAAQILTRHLPLHFKLFYSPYGPVLDWEMPYAEEILTEIKNYLTKLLDHRYLFWKIEPLVTTEQGEKWKIPDILEKVGFRKAMKSIQPQNTIIVDLQKSETELLESFEKDTRYSIRRGEREEVEVKEFNNPLNNQPLKEFYDLYTLTAKRGKFPPRSWNQFARLWEEMAPDQVRLYQAWYKTTLLAAAVVFTLKPKAFLVYAGSIRDEQYKNKFPTYFIQWEVMKSLQKEKFTSYDLWGVVPKEATKHSWAGISLFKRGFRGTEVNYVGAYDLPLSPFYDLFPILDNLRHKITHNPL